MSIKEHEILRKGSSILLGIALENAVLDIETNETQLRECLKLLQDPHRASRSERTMMGTFGCYSVSLDVDKDCTASIFIEDPYFEPTRSQSAAIWLTKTELQRLLLEALEGASTSIKT
jgi:hypothetical protein